MTSNILFKFTYSSDFSLAYLDIVDYHKEQKDYDFTSNTRFPLTLMLSGQGTFIHPFKLEIYDSLFQSL